MAVYHSPLWLLVVAILCIWSSVNSYTLVVTRKSGTADSFMLTDSINSVKSSICGDVFGGKAEGLRQTISNLQATIRCTCVGKETLLSNVQQHSNERKCVKRKDLKGMTGCSAHDTGSETMDVHSYSLTGIETPSGLISTVTSEDKEFKNCLENSKKIWLEDAHVWNDTKWSDYNKQVMSDMYIDVHEDAPQLMWKPTDTKARTLSRLWTYNGLLLMLFLKCSSSDDNESEAKTGSCFLLRFDGSRTYPLDLSQLPTLQPPATEPQSVRPSASLSSTLASDSTTVSSSSERLKTIQSSVLVAPTASIFLPYQTSDPPSNTAWKSQILNSSSLSIPSSVYHGYSSTTATHSQSSIFHSSRFHITSSLSISSSAFHGNNSSTAPTQRPPGASSSDSNSTTVLIISISSVLVLIFLVIVFVLVIRLNMRKIKDRKNNSAEEPHPYETPGVQPKATKHLGGRGGNFNRGFVMGTLPYYESPIDGKPPNEGDYAVPDKEGKYMGLKQAGIEAEDKYEPLNPSTLKQQQQNRNDEYHVYKELEKYE